MSPASYQKALSTFDAQLTLRFRDLGGARRQTTVRTKMSVVQLALSNAKTDLERLDPPTAVQSAHAALLDAVATLATDLANAESAAAGGQVCAGSSATALISRSDGARQVRAAAAKVAAADPSHKYRVGGFMPPSQADRNQRLGNGTMIRSPTGGSGRLEIDNGGGNDTVVSMVRVGARTPVLTVYVRGGAKTNVGRIRDGTYRIFMTGGQDWDPALHVFTRNCNFQQFDNTFPFTTTYTANGSTSRGWKITLLPVVGGNASTSDVAPDNFPTN